LKKSEQIRVYELLEGAGFGVTTGLCLEKGSFK